MAETGLAKTDIAGLDLDAFKQGLKDQKAQRKLVAKYIEDQLVKKIDYGVIPGTGNKPTLLKPGAEKFASLLDLVATFEKDSDTWEMLGSEGGTIAYRCQLKTKKSGTLVGEGRGVCSVKEKTWEKNGKTNADTAPNTAVKTAEKRAMVDAVLRVFSLSEIFTQDVEDMPVVEGGSQGSSNGSGKGVQTETGELATQPQQNYVKRLLSQKDHSLGDVDVPNLTKKQAHDMIEDLLKLEDKDKGIDQTVVEAETHE